MRAALTFVVVGALAAGCDGLGSGGADSGRYSCDITTGGVHKCIESSWTGGAYPTESWASHCASSGGVGGDGCPRTAAVGGCRTRSSTGAIDLTQTEWYYAGSVSVLTLACEMAGGAFVWP